MRVRVDHRVVLALILVLALLVRVVPLTYSHFWDETVFLQDAKVIVDGRTNYDEFFERPPLLSIVYALGFALWDNIYVANLMQGLWTTTAVLFAFVYVRKAFGLLSGLCAAFLLAFGPYFVETSHDLLTDMPALALMLAAMWLFDKSGAPFALLAGSLTRSRSRPDSLPCFSCSIFCSRLLCRRGNFGRWCFWASELPRPLLLT